MCCKMSKGDIRVKIITSQLKHMLYTHVVKFCGRREKGRLILPGMGLTIKIQNYGSKIF